MPVATWLVRVAVYVGLLRVAVLVQMAIGSAHLFWRMGARAFIMGMVAMLVTQQEPPNSPRNKSPFGIASTVMHDAKTRL